MSTIFNTARGSQNINQARVVVDMSSEISLLKPRVTPLTTLTKKLGTKATHNYRFDWMEDDLLARWVNCTAGAASGATTVALGTGEGSLVAQHDLLKVVATGEVIRVTTVSTDSLTVVRGYGETATAAIPANAKILVIGNAMAQGSGAAPEKYHNVANVFNYTQIFKTPFAVTNTLNAMKLYGDSELARLHRHKGIEHAMSIEYSLLFGERRLDTVGAQPTTTTGGVLKFLSGTSNVININKATGGMKDLDGAVEKVFQFGSDRKVWLCSPSMITWVNQLAQGKLEIIQGDNDKTFGLDITTYQTPHGRLSMIHHPLLTQGYDGFSFALDMEELKFRPLEGRDTSLKTNIQNNDEDGRRDMFITEAGLELRSPKKHAIIKLV